MRYDNRIKEDKKNGTYFFVLSAGRGKDGKRRQIKRRGFKTKRDAHKKLVEIEYLINSGTFDLGDKTLDKEEPKTLGEYIQLWLNQKKREITDETLVVYNQGIQIIPPELKEKELQDLSKRQMDQFLDQLIEDEYSTTYIHMIFRPIKSIFSDALDEGLIKRNPLKNIKLPSKKTLTTDNIWSEEESSTFLNTVRERFMKNLVDDLSKDPRRKPSRCYIVYYIALFTGMRIGEILALTWENINFTEKFISVIKTLTKKGQVVNRTKSKSSTRIVMISDLLVEELKFWKSYQESEMKRWGYKTDLVISSTKGTPIHQNRMNEYFDREIELSGVKGIKFHDMRHTHATLLLMKEVPAKAVQERLGHSSIIVTLDTYSHVVPQLQRSVADKLDSIFNLVS